MNKFSLPIPCHKCMKYGLTEFRGRGVYRGRFILKPDETKAMVHPLTKIFGFVSVLAKKNGMSVYIWRNGDEVKFQNLSHKKITGDFMVW